MIYNACVLQMNVVITNITILTVYALVAFITLNMVIDLSGLIISSPYSADKQRKYWV
jgi:hypothetical protein